METKEQITESGAAEAPRSKIKIWYTLLTALVSLALTAGLLLVLLGTSGIRDNTISVNTDIPDIYDMYLTGQISTVLEGIVPIKRIYRLSDSDLVAPKPNQACYGQTDDPAAMQEVLDAAAELLNGQQTLFTTETPVLAGTTISYYLDESILAITWKQRVDDNTYTFAEVKIAHASQFRRYLSGGKYNSGTHHTTSEMAESVNAVVASSGDFYGYRSCGVVVLNGLVYREKGQWMDTCYIDENGDLLFTRTGEITDKEAAQKFVDDNNIRFSLCFGPVMIQGGKCCVPYNYSFGEINDKYARAALCQLDTLHYVVVDANYEHSRNETPTVRQFAKNLVAMGIPTAYALDGGQTATIVLNNQVINRVSYGAQRSISDILYFATAIPEDRH